MREKAIIDRLIKVVDDFVKPLSPYVANAIRRGSICGGCIPSMLMNAPYSDYDLYLRSKTDVDIVNNYFREPNPAHEVTLLTENSINLKGKVQIITRFYGKPQDIVKAFDFTYLASYYYIFNKELVIPDHVYKLCLTRELIYQGTLFPLSTLIRLRKLIKKGWWITAREMLKIFLDAHSMLNGEFIREPERIKAEKGDQITDEYEEYFEEGLENEPEKVGYREPDIFDLHARRAGQTINVREFSRQIAGVDPLLIQDRLHDHMDSDLTVDELVNLINDDD